MVVIEIQTGAVYDEYRFDRVVLETRPLADERQLVGAGSSDKF